MWQHTRVPRELRYTLKFDILSNSKSNILYRHMLCFALLCMFTVAVACWSPSQHFYYGASLELIDQSSVRSETTSHTGPQPLELYPVPTCCQANKGQIHIERLAHLSRRAWDQNMGHLGCEPSMVITTLCNVCVLENIIRFFLFFISNQQIFFKFTTKLLLFVVITYPIARVQNVCPDTDFQFVTSLKRSLPSACPGHS